MANMGSRRCCCSSCKCGETTITADGTVEWFTHTVNEDGTITRVDHEGSCKTYYVDSASGGGAESGTGTEEDPWTNLNTVFSDTCIRIICNGGESGSVGCPKIKILVKGTIDYAVTGNPFWNYQQNLIVEPWDTGPTISVISDTFGITAFTYIIGVVWKNFTVTARCTFTGYEGGHGGIGFDTCTDSAFDTMDVSGESSGANTVGTAFYSCSNSQFDGCTGHGHETDTTYSYGYGIAFFYSDHSTFKNCSGTGTTTSTNGNGCGFDGCTDSVFDTCSGNGTGLNISCGFHANTSSVFTACTGTPSGSPCDI